MAPPNLSPKDNSKRISTTELTVMERSFSGPLPPPETLSKYNEILPGAAERIVAMAEKQQMHRQNLEKKVVFGNAASQTRGNYLGFFVAMTAILGGLWLIYLGKEVTGLVAIITPIIGLVGVFVYGKHLQREELDEKEKPFKGSKRRS